MAPKKFGSQEVQVRSLTVFRYLSQIKVKDTNSWFCFLRLKVLKGFNYIFNHVTTVKSVQNKAMNVRMVIIRPP